jgi:hypothetical protein
VRALDFEPSMVAAYLDISCDGGVEILFQRPGTEQLVERAVRTDERLRLVPLQWDFSDGGAGDADADLRGAAP